MRALAAATDRHVLLLELLYGYLRLTRYRPRTVEDGGRESVGYIVEDEARESVGFGVRPSGTRNLVHYISTKN